MMTEGKTIVLGTTMYSLDDVIRQDAKSFPPFERSVVELCQKWTNGEEEFEVPTSGSTGVPKTIRFHRRQLEASAMLTAAALKLNAGMTALLCLDPAFIAGKMMVVRCLVTGMNLVAVNPVANPFDHLPDSNTKVDFAAMVPLQVRTILDSKRAAELGKVGVVIIGGGQVDEGLRAKLNGYQTAFYSTFGMTETISHVALQKLNGDDATNYMKALPGVGFNTDERGCLVIDAPFVGDTSVITNDVVELIDQETFRWLGRWDNVINSGGIKVIPETLEPVIGQVLSKLGVHQRFFVFGQQHGSLGSEVVLVIEGELKPDLQDTILAAAKNQLPKYSAPRQIRRVENFLFTPTGKVKRKETFELASPRPGVSPDVNQGI